MSIPSEIARLINNVADAYTAAAEKGAAMPDKQNSANLATTILSIPTGVDLPELPNPAAETEVFAGKEYINASGEKKTGAFTIDAEITEQDSLLAQIRTALVGKTAAGGSEVPMQEKTVNITENGTHEILPDDGYGLSKAVVNVNVEASGGASEYYTITNNTGLDLVICDHVVTAGTTVDIPVDVNTMREMGGYLLVHSWLDNVITPTKTYIVATVNGSVPTQSPKNRINRITFYVGSQSYAVFMAGVDIATLSGSTLVQPASGSTIVLTLSA